MAAQEPLPVYTQLSDLYGSLGTTINHAKRWSNLAEEFQKRFGKKPAYIARAPGRVNLIGEHVDYSLFGCLPAAIERDILIACAPRDGNVPGHVNAHNLYHKYTSQSFSPSAKRRESVSSISEDKVHAEEWHLDINTKELRWESYVKAGYYGVLNEFFAGQGQPVPVDLLVTGTVPAGSGLSSSAAMVVASTLAFLAANGKLEDNLKPDGPKISKGDLVKLAVANEMRVGVNSGGMDQAASVICGPSSALYITFFPNLFASPVPLPQGAVFVCANSLVVADKALSAKVGYNLRVVETLVAARILARRLDLSVAPNEKITLREVLGRLGAEKKDEEMSIEQLGELLLRMETEVNGLKPEGSSDQYGVTLDKMISLSGLDATTFTELYLSRFAVEADYFQLFKRAKHVFSESLRVLKFRQACLDTKQGDLLTILGDLMNESQKSCSELFECSCPELEQLTTLAREAGAIGSRLTGAGWGGCTVSLVPEDRVEAFIAKLSETYPPYQGLEGERLSEVIFATKPSSGACVYKFE